MKQYRNLGGNFGILAYATGEDRIDVEFEPSSEYTYTKYRYTHESAGAEKVEEMKRLAEEGKGLSSFINEHVKDKYSHKW